METRRVIDDSSGFHLSLIRRIFLTRSLIVLLLISPAGCNSGKKGQPQADAPAAPEANNSVVAAPDISIIDAAVAGNVAAIKQHIESRTNIDQNDTSLIERIELPWNTAKGIYQIVLEFPTESGRSVKRVIIYARSVRNV